MFLVLFIKDLTAHKAQVALERGQKITKEKIVDFVAMLLKGDPNDKEYQKKLIDNLVYKVFVYDDTVVTYLTFSNDKEIKEIDLADNNKVLSAIKVQSLSSLVRHLYRMKILSYKIRHESVCFRGVFRSASCGIKAVNGMPYHTPLKANSNNKPSGNNSGSGKSGK